MLQRLFRHNAWADEQIIIALRRNPSHDAVRREYAHILAVEAVWLGRVGGRQATLPVWPDLSIRQCDDLRSQVRDDFDGFLQTIQPAQLDAEISYVNTAGQPFTNTLGDILLHTALHGQYHRGKVNLLLRQIGDEPMPVDYIAFVRGAPAARS